jgi:hypothetical protein
VLERGKPVDNTLVHTQEQTEPGGPITHRWDPRSNVLGRTTQTFPSQSGTPDELYVYSLETEEALAELEASIKDGGNPRPTEAVGGSWVPWKGAEVPPPNDKQKRFGAAMESARVMLQSYYAKRGLGQAQAEEQAMVDLGITRDADTKEETLTSTPQEILAKLPTIRNNLRKQSSRGGATNRGGTPTNTGGNTAKDVQGMGDIEIPSGMTVSPDGRIIWDPRQ